MSAPVPAADRPVTAPDFAAAKGQRRLTVLTAYDYTTARLFDAAGVDALLVGDSLGMVVQGNPDCLRVTLDEMIYHTRCVARGAKRALVIGDMPFLSFQLSAEQALANAGRMIKESDAQAVKLEGGERTAPAIERMVAAGIPVMAHIGLTPQSVRQFGGFKVQRDAVRLKADAKAVESAGAFAVVVECVPTDLAGELTALIKIPTIGIGAGNQCDGQVLVGADMLGLFDDVRPKFVKHFGELGVAARQAAEAYCRDVRSGAYPGPEYSFR
jgi:3-methyl-2-oxobutanoate hydroxymethyltransferase